MKISPGLAALLLAVSPVSADSVAANSGASAFSELSASTQGPASTARGSQGASPVAASTQVSLSPVRDSPGPGPVPGPTWSWPLSPRPAVLRAFNPPAKPWLSGHRGVDLEAAQVGAPLISPAAGTVSFVGTVVDRPVITIDHGNGLRSSFEPVTSSLAAGSAVAEGDVLGQVQAGHCGPAPPCVHWGVRRGEDYVNPLAFVMDLRPSVLLQPIDVGPS